MVFFNYLGQLGNCIFIVCSSYFLLDSKSVRANKVYKMIFDNWIVSVSFLTLFLLIGLPVSNIDIIKSVFPITFKTNWFIGCYILFYLIHPLLNLILNNINKKKLLLIVIIVSFLYLGINLIGRHFYYYNKLMGFIIIYFIVAFYKSYQNILINKRQHSIKISLVGLLCIGLTIVALNAVGLRFSYLSDKVDWLNTFVNPLCILTSLALLNYSNGIKFHAWSFINTISSLSLLIYIIHENYLLSHYIKPEIWRMIYERIGYDLLVLYFIMLSLMTFVFGCIFAFLYSSLWGTITANLACKAETYYRRKFLHLYNYIQKYDNEI